MKTTPILLICLVVWMSSVWPQNPPPTLSIQPVEKKRLSIPEPSDLTWFSGAWWVVSDNGWLYRCAPDFSACQKTSLTGADFEAVTTDGKVLWISEESLRLIHAYDEPLNRITTWHARENGALNAGFEALAWDPDRRILIGITESPPVVFEWRDGMQLALETRLSFRGDVSAATVHKGKLWVLSDESRKIFVHALPDYKLEKVFRLHVVNPEGIAFDEKGRLLILSDDRQTVYFYSLEE